MSKKFWTLKPAQFYTKPNPNGHRNEIGWAAVGKKLFTFRMRSTLLALDKDPSNT